MKKKFQISDVIKYFCSYLLILMVLIIGFYLIIQNQFADIFLNQRVDSTMSQMERVAEQLNDELAYLEQMDTLISQNAVLSKYRHKNKLLSKEKYLISSEVIKYDKISRLINGIVYRMPSTNTIISTNLVVDWQDHLISIANEDSDDLTFDYEKCIESGRAQLFLLDNGKVSRLIYVPVTRKNSSYSVFFMLDMYEIERMMSTLVDSERSGVALVNTDGEVLISTDREPQALQFDGLVMQSGSHTLDTGDILCVRAGIYTDCSLTVVVSKDTIQQQVTQVFTSSYIALFGLGLVGFLLVFLGMHFTYVPLRKMVRNNLPGLESEKNYMELLDASFGKMSDENRILQGRLEELRRSVHSHLLDSLVRTAQVGEEVNIPEIEHFFEPTVERSFFVLQVSCGVDENGEISGPAKTELEVFMQELTSAVSSCDVCLIDDKKQDKASFLVAVSAQDCDEKEQLLTYLEQVHEKKGWLSALSYSSESVLDIPLLYENARQAGDFWPGVPVAASKYAGTDRTNTYAYPHEELKILSESYKRYDYAKARLLVGKLLDLTESCYSEESVLKNYFIPCVLIDILLGLMNAMTTENIDFAGYSELYYATLYYCRSCSYKEKKEEIRKNILQMLEFFEKTTGEQRLRRLPIRQFIEENYTSPELSIKMLADKFHVSSPYMSQIFMKELNKSFVDYVWELRMHKSKELLRDTELTVEEIAVRVGYTNVSSFRRRFKLETGLTPTEFRQKCSGNMGGK